MFLFLLCTFFQISIVNRENVMETVLGWLPSKWSNWLTCRMGEKWPECDTKHIHPESFHYKRCQLLYRINQQRGRHCHFDRFSKFTLRYEVFGFLFKLSILYYALHIVNIIALFVVLILFLCQHLKRSCIIHTLILRFIINVVPNESEIC